MKKVSVLISAYNEEQYLKTAVDSALSQEGVDVEVVIVDDGSTDGTWRVMLEYIDDQRVKVKKLHHQGKVVAFNLGFELSTGDYLCYMGADDILPAGNLVQRSSRMMSDRLEASLCKIRMISTDKRFDGTIVPKDPGKGTFSGGAMMFTRSLGKLIFPIPEHLGNEDQWSSEIIRTFASEIIHIPSTAYEYRIHEGNDSKKTGSFAQKSRSMHKRFIVYGVFLEKFREQLTREQISRLEYLSALETLRWNRASLSILLFTKAPFSERMRYFSYSKAVYFYFRTRLNKFLSGL